MFWDRCFKGHLNTLLITHSPAHVKGLGKIAPSMPRNSWPGATANFFFQEHFIEDEKKKILKELFPESTPAMHTWNMQDLDLGAAGPVLTLLPLRKSNSKKWGLFCSPISTEGDG